MQEVFRILRFATVINKYQVYYDSVVWKYMPINVQLKDFPSSMRLLAKASSTKLEFIVFRNVAFPYTYFTDILHTKCQTSVAHFRCFLQQK